MKVLMLGWELPPHNSGGLGIACYHLCKALSTHAVDIEFILPYEANHGIDFMDITAASPQDVEEVVRSGIAYDSCKYVLRDGRIEWHDLFDQERMYERAVARLARARVFDIIHAHDWLTFRAALRAKESSGCPVILQVHSIESDRAGGQGGNPFVRSIEEMAFQAADKIVAVSDFTRQGIVREYGIPADKIEVVHNSLSQEDLLRPDYNLANTYQYLASLRAQGYRVVTNVGRLTVQKGLTNFLRAAKLVAERVPKTMFMIVGAGDQYFELIELAAELGIGKHVIFTGFQRGKPWRDAFAISDLFVMPSVSEPFGLVALEAVGYGTPALISKQSGVREVLHNALTVDFWDVNEMANKIIAVVQNDPLRDELLANASEEIKRLSWSTAADKVFDMYRSCTKNEAVPA